jgi:hypothetical protein
MLTPAQYMRIERAAGGVHASDRALIRAARKILAPSVRRDRSARAARHALYREVTRTRNLLLNIR